MTGYAHYPPAHFYSRVNSYTERLNHLFEVTQLIGGRAGV